MKQTGSSYGRRGVLALLGALPLAGVASTAPERPRLRFSLDWVPTGAHSPFLLAADGGLFAARGLAVEVQRGHGAGDTVARVAAGEFDVGLADLTAVVQHNARQPANPVTAFYMVHEQSPLAVISLAEKNIRTPADLEGKILGAPDSDAGRNIFPLFAAAAGFDAGRVRWVSMEPALREAKLVAGDVDAITGFSGTTQFLQMQGVRPDRIRVMRFAEHGLHLYSSALFARADFLRRHPRTAAAFARASNDALQASIAQPARAIEALVRRLGGRARPELELQRLRQTLDELVLTPAARRHGLSHVDAQRLAANIDAICRALQLPSVPAAASVFRADYLPPRAERLLTAAAAGPAAR